MKIIITGGTGFIGSRLALKYLEDGHKVEVIGLTNTPAEEMNKNFLEQKGVVIHLTSVTDRERINKIISSDTSIIFHLAATQHEMNIPDQKFWDVNVEGTRNVLDASVNAGVKRFIHGSTIGVYGILNGVIDEDSPCKPDNIYGVTKLTGEMLVLSYKDKIPVTVIRIPETYGPGDRRLLKLFKTIKKKLCIIIGNGRNFHPIIYIEDLTNGFLLAASCEPAIGKVLLFSGKDTVSTTYMFDTISSSMGIKPHQIKLPLAPVWIAAILAENVLRPLKIQPPIHRRRIDFFKKNFKLSDNRAKNTINFDPKVSFKEGVLKTLIWYRDNQLL